MARFSLKDLFVGVTLVAIGVAMLTYIFTKPGNPPMQLVAAMLLIGGTLVGAGLCFPFGDMWTWAGAVLGFFAMFSLFMVAVVGRMAGP